MNFDQIRQDTKALRDFATKLDNLMAEIADLEKNSPSSKLEQIEKSVTNLEKLLGNSPEEFTPPLYLTDWLQKEKEDIKERKSVKQFASKLSNGLKELGLSLKGHEVSGLEVGCLFLQLNFTRDRVTIFYGREKELLAESQIRVAKVKALIGDYLSNGGLGSNIAVDNLFTKLNEAYDRVARNHQLVGQYVPINDLLPELALLIQNQKFLENPLQENYKSYKRADFSYDLLRLKASGYSDKGLGLKIATSAYTQSTQGYLWIPKSTKSLDGSCYSHLILRQVDQPNTYEVTPPPAPSNEEGEQVKPLQEISSQLVDADNQ